MLMSAPAFRKNPSGDEEYRPKPPRLQRSSGGQ
jgi:hypothetical protein